MKETNRNRKIQEIDYTKTSFSEIKAELVSYVKRHYPDTYKDFNKTSFGSLMFDLVSYIGDQLHYYSDHNANEAIPAFTKDPEILISHINTLGADPVINPIAVGYVEVQVLRPTVAVGPQLDENYEVELRAGSTYMSKTGAVYTQIRDITLNEENSSVVGYNTNQDGSKIDYYILKAKVPVISGQEKQYSMEVGEYRRFLKIEIPDETFTEVISVTDENGNEYYQVDHLTQNVIYKPIQDPKNQDSQISSIMRAVPVPRRFIVEKTPNKTKLVFGYGSDEDLNTAAQLDPSKVTLKMSGKNYIASPRIDPNVLMSTNKLGVAPQNTTITITYRSNTLMSTNAAVGTVTEVLRPILFFKNEQDLEQQKINFIENNVQVYNEEPINGSITIPNTEELRRRYLGAYGAQGRAVTKQDYIAATYAMPPIYGSVKRASVIRDNDDLKRNINLYLIAESAAGHLQQPSDLLKENVRTWINSVRMISDSVDIFPAKIVNFGLEFSVSLKSNVNHQTVLSEIKNRIYEELKTVPPEIGEHFYVSEVLRIIQNIPEVKNVPIKDGIKITSLTGGQYTDYLYDIRANTSPDNSYIYIPEDTIWEIKYLDDIKGTVMR